MVDIRAILAVLVCGLMVACVAVCAIPTARAELNTAVGDFWKYEFDGVYEGVDMSGEMKYWVEESTSSDGHDAFVVLMTGSSEFMGMIEGIHMSAEVDMNGYELRLADSYALVEMSLVMDYDFVVDGESYSMEIGASGVYTPAAECHLGDDSLIVDTPVTHEYLCEAETWISMLGENISMSFTYEVSQTVTLVDDSVEVDTPVGLLDCQQIQIESYVEETTGSGYSQTVTADNYYCEDVGNFVTGSGDWMLSDYGISDMELKAYSYDGVTVGESSSFLSGNGLLLIGLVVVVVLVAAVVVVRRSRKKAVGPMDAGPTMPYGIAPPPEDEPIAESPPPVGPPPEPPAPPGAP